MKMCRCRQHLHFLMDIMLKSAVKMLLKPTCLSCVTSSALRVDSASNRARSPSACAAFAAASAEACHNSTQVADLPPHVDSSLA